MKKIFFVLATLMAAITVNAATPASKLVKRLNKIHKVGYMFGHQDDPFYGLTWEWDMDRSDTKELVGDYPAVMGFDLGGIEVADQKNLDSVPFARIHNEIIKHHQRGGIITISWHPRNPVTGGTAWDVSNKEVVKNILPGGKEHQKFQTWMKRVGDFLAELKTPQGEPVPVIFRPWHECNGSWFWWGKDLCTGKEYKEMWNMLQDYLYSRGLTNLVYSYSPNLDGGWDLLRWYDRYPGDDRVQIIGEDAYQWGTEEDFNKQLRDDLLFISVYARNHDKLYALTECGYKNMPDTNWWNRVLKRIMDSFDITYFLPWRNYKKEYFGPAKGAKGDTDFIKLYKADNTLFLNEIKNIK